MTNPIPAWSANLAVNIPKPERALLGKLSVRFGARSVGSFVKELIALGLAQKCEASAEELKAIRRQYYGAALLVLICGLTVGEMISASRSVVRVARTVRVARCNRTGKTEWEHDV